MKNKAQGKALIIILLIIIAIALIVIVLKPSTAPTGRVIIGNSPIESKFLIEETCMLSAPFICEDSSIATTKGVKLYIRNGGADDVFLQRITLTNCLEKEDLTYNGEIEGIFIGSGSTKVLTLVCDKELKDTFRGNIEIIYEVVGSSTKSEATGNIIKNVM